MLTEAGVPAVLWENNMLWDYNKDPTKRKLLTNWQNLVIINA
jgi:hypothetical protein